MKKNPFRNIYEQLSRKLEARLVNYAERLAQTAEKGAGDLMKRGEDVLREAVKDAGAKLVGKIDPRLVKLLSLAGDDTGSRYSTIITDDPDHPFQMSDAIKEQARLATNGTSAALAKAKALFDWFDRHIDYGDGKRPADVGYRHAKEVLADAEGVCGEMAVLYIVMARSVGLKADFVHVTKDHQNKTVHHACAAVYLDHGPILVDPAYHLFGVAHREVAIKMDAEAVPLLKTFRKNTRSTS